MSNEQKVKLCEFLYYSGHMKAAVFLAECFELSIFTTKQRERTGLN